MIKKKLDKKFYFRLDKEKWDSFEITCKSNDDYPSRILRVLINKYIEDNQTK